MPSGSKKVAYAALTGNTLIAITKFIAAAFTGSSAMLSEGFHSVVDTGNQILLLYGMKKAKRPPDESFPFGHGKEIYFWSFVVAILIFALGAGISTYEGITHIRHPEPIKNAVANFIVLGCAALFEGGSLFIAAREFNRTRDEGEGFFEAVRNGKDPAMFVVLFEDSAAMLGLAAACTGLILTLLTGTEFWDGMASVVIGFILGTTAILLARETKGLLVGEAADPQIVTDIRKLGEKYEAVERVNDVYTLHMGPDYVLANISVAFRDCLAVGQIEEIIESLTSAIKRNHPKIQRVFIEAEEKT